MKQQIITEADGKRYLCLQVHPNITYAFISSTGKSLVYRVMGEYLKRNGEVTGTKDMMSSYISHPIKCDDFIEINHRHYHQSDIIKHEFYRDGMVASAIKIPIMK